MRPSSSSDDDSMVPALSRYPEREQRDAVLGQAGVICTVDCVYGKHPSERPQTDFSTSYPVCGTLNRTSMVQLEADRFIALADRKLFEVSE